jgi:hypothetical protein
MSFPFIDLMVFGDKDCGKSSFLQLDKNNIEQSENIERRIFTLSSEDGKSFSFRCMDVYGKCMPLYMNNFYYNNAVILLDLSKDINLDEIFYWISTIYSKMYVSTFVVGNKKDLITSESEKVKELKSRLSQLNVSYEETNSLELDLSIYGKIVQKHFKLDLVPILSIQ